MNVASPIWKKTYEYTGSSPSVSSSIPLFLKPGMYFFECWGASGMDRNADSIGGNGGFSSGYISFFKPITLYLFIGGKHTTDYYLEYSFNGGGMSQYGGGGATDIRLINGTWDDFESLRSRIIVAGGGGGSDTSDNGGSGGGLHGLPSEKNHGRGGTQNTGGYGFVNGSFGKGGGFIIGSNRNGGGGSGYYGGGTSDVENNYGGGGGSSYISGYPGCDSISEDSTPSEIHHAGHPFHYSGHVFTFATMIDGQNLMPSPYGNDTIGHIGNGFARITMYSTQNSQCNHNNDIFYMFLPLLLYTFYLYSSTG